MPKLKPTGPRKRKTARVRGVSPVGGKVELNPDMATHPSSNQTWCKLTSLSETNALQHYSAEKSWKSPEIFFCHLIGNPVIKGKDDDDCDDDDDDDDASDADGTVQHWRTSSVYWPQIHITCILRSLWLHDLRACSPWAPVQRYFFALLGIELRGIAYQFTVLSINEVDLLRYST